VDFNDSQDGSLLQ